MGLTGIEAVAVAAAAVGIVLALGLGFVDAFETGFEAGVGVGIEAEVDSFQSSDCTWAFPNWVLDMSPGGNRGYFQGNTLDKDPYVGYIALDRVSSDSFGASGSFDSYDTG